MQFGKGGAKQRGCLVRENPGRHARLLSRPLDLLAVLVRSREEEHLVTEQPMPARDRVGHQRRVRVAEVRRGIDVVDRRRDVEAQAGVPSHPTIAGAISRWLRSEYL